MVTLKSITGAGVTMLLFLGSVITCILSVLAHLHVILPIVLAVFSIILGYVVIANDWPKVWKPLFTNKS